ncbi:hypothetical protein J4E89_006857 [Alternaria sp. Ai002NY15]|nr:hypothetical protein J4E89_006857 [Alternaria sp. Ai002NY15]
MDPFRNNAAAVSNAKATTLHNTPTSTPFNTLPTHSESYQPYQDDNPAPPAYHTVVDPTLPIPNMTNPYDPQEEDCDTQETPDDTPEITINAATQIRGHGNIISIAQMDSVRIANLIATVLSGETIEAGKIGEEEDTAGRPLTPESPTTATARGECTSTTQVRGVKRYSNINITVNCGATIIGDRNIVGPGLGDIARQMQMAQRNQAALLAQQRMQQQQQAAAAAAAVGGQAQRMPSPPLQQRNISPNGVLFPMKPATPPMSRSSSLNSEVGGGGRKRKCEDGGEGAAAKRRG